MITRRDYVKVNEKKSQFAALNDFNKSRAFESAYRNIKCTIFKAGASFILCQDFVHYLHRPSSVLCFIRYCI